MRAICGILCMAFAATAEASGPSPRWIWYPGDYGLWWGNELQSQRLQWGARLPPFWPMYEPHTRVLFRKDNLDMPADEELEIRCDGHATVCTCPSIRPHALPIPRRRPVSPSCRRRRICRSR